MTKKPTKLPSLEDSLAEVTHVIDKMEHGELTLEQSLTHFERGITLIKHCQKVLTDAEQKVQQLIQKNNQDLLAPYGEDESEEPNENND